MRAVHLKNQGYLAFMLVMYIVVLGSLAISGYAVSTHLVLTKILDVDSNLINDVTILHDLKVTQNLQCNAQLNTLTRCLVQTGYTTTNAHIQNAITINNQIVTATDAQLFVNSTRTAHVAQSQPISFTVPANGSQLEILVPMNVYEFKLVSGDPAFFQFATNASQQTSRALALDTGLFSVAVQGNFTLSALLSKPVSLLVSLVAYDSKMVYAGTDTTNEFSNIVAVARVEFKSPGSFEINQTFTVPVLPELELFGLQMLLLYSLANTSDAPTVEFSQLDLFVYQNL